MPFFEHKTNSCIKNIDKKIESKYTEAIEKRMCMDQIAYKTELPA